VLLILAAFLEGRTLIRVFNPGELPWIGLTLHWLDRFNIRYENREFSQYTVIGPNSLQGFEYTVPSDWSSAAFPIAAALVTNSEITLENISFDDPQGDKEIIAALEKMGARFTQDKQGKCLHVHKHEGLSGATLDVNHIIDAVPVLAVVASFALTSTTFIGARIARQKDSDRLSTISAELKKMGAHIDELEDGLTIHPSHLRGAEVFSHYDHRIAMALAVAALGSKNTTIIKETSCVAKSFPGFVEAMRGWRASIEELAV